MLPEFDKLSQAKQNRIMAAITKRLRWYEEIIERLKSHDKVFNSDCQVCRAVEDNANMWFLCGACPLRPSNNAKCVTKSRKMIGNVYNNAAVEGSIWICRWQLKYVKRRFKELLRRLEKNGFQYK